MFWAPCDKVPGGEKKKVCANGGKGGLCCATGFWGEKKVPQEGGAQRFFWGPPKRGFSPVGDPRWGGRGGGNIF